MQCRSPLFGTFFGFLALLFLILLVIFQYCGILINTLFLQGYPQSMELQRRHLTQLKYNESTIKYRLLTILLMAYLLTLDIKKTRLKLQDHYSKEKVIINSVPSSLNCHSVWEKKYFIFSSLNPLCQLPTLEINGMK